MAEKGLEFTSWKKRIDLIGHHTARIYFLFSKTENNLWSKSNYLKFDKLYRII
jgi:hypothetical protein